MSAWASLATGLLVFSLGLAYVFERNRRQRQYRVEVLYEYLGARPQPRIQRRLMRLRNSWQGLADRFVERFQWGRNLEDQLFFADFNVRALTFVAICTIFFFLWLASLFVLTSNWFVAILASVVIVLAGSNLVMRFRTNAKQRAFQRELPEFLLLVASSLRSGIGLMQSLDSVSQQGNGEVERQFRRTSRDIALGMSTPIALRALASRSNSQDMNWVVVAIEIQREVGGNLAELLESVALAVRDQAEITDEVRVISAESRLSATVLVFLPLVVAAALWILNREYVLILVEHPVGQLLGFVFLGLFAVGAIWMRQTTRIKV